MNANCLDLYHKSPDFGERQYKNRAWKRRFDAHPDHAAHGPDVALHVILLLVEQLGRHVAGCAPDMGVWCLGFGIWGLGFGVQG